MPCLCLRFAPILALACVSAIATAQNRPELAGPAVQAPKHTSPQHSYVQRQTQPGKAAPPARQPAAAVDPNARGAYPAAQANTATPRSLLPVRAPRVTYSNGLLSIVADNCTLSDVLSEVRRRTGAAIEAPASAASERVVISIGPAPANDVLTTLLNGSRFDYIILGSHQAVGAPQRLILREKQTLAQAGAPGNQHANGMANSPGAQVPQQAPDQEEEFVPEAEIPDEVQQEPQQPDQQGAPGQQQPGQQQVKTPEQLLQELQQMQQQQQQQQQQPQHQPGTQPDGNDQPNLRPQSNDESQRQQQPQMQPQQQPPDSEAPPDLL